MKLLNWEICLCRQRDCLETAIGPQGGRSSSLSSKDTVILTHTGHLISDFSCCPKCWGAVERLKTSQVQASLPPVGLLLRVFHLLYGGTPPRGMHKVHNRGKRGCNFWWPNKKKIKKCSLLLYTHKLLRNRPSQGVEDT